MKPELMSPVGNWSMLKAAIDAGADAIYFGFKGLNMRAAAKNFTLKDLTKIGKIDEVRKYLCLNTITFDNEIGNVRKVLDAAKENVDAIICWDMANMQEALKRGFEIHLSTQASVANSEAAKFYKGLGVKRLNLARELNLKQVSEISRVIDTEVFVHGAMCVSLSGRCFISQEMFKKSANRGECLQPCRREYLLKDVETGDELKIGRQYVMSPKDLCTLPFLKKIINSGVKALKIEGRNRSPEYVKVVTEVYREALDNPKINIDYLLEKLSSVYNRKFSSGFYLGLPTAEDWTDAYGSAATKRKVEVGRIVKYYPKIKVAAIEILTKDLNIGDDILIIGDETGVVELKIKEMEINNKKVKKVKKGEDVAVKIGKEVKRGDMVYKWVEV